MNKYGKQSAMRGGNAIRSIEPDTQEIEPVEYLLTDEEQVNGDLDLAENDDWTYLEEQEKKQDSWLVRNGATLLATGLIFIWTSAFLWAKRNVLSVILPLDQWLGLIGDWALPVTLIVVVWLFAIRTSRRETQRFGDAARLLSIEATKLEQRMVTINGELSLAREFITAQARDLESLGRIATDRLGQSSEKLHGLIHTNTAQIESIATVSEAALTNMEKLRGQLPVIANSARDVTNNIGNAGRTAHAQLQEMIAGFKRLNEFGQASERQVESLRTLVHDTIDQLTSDIQLMEQIAERRFASFASESSTLRTELEEYESQAITSLQSRVKDLTSEIAQCQNAVTDQEVASVQALEDRIAALRNGAETVSSTLQDRENTALEILNSRFEKIDAEIAVRNQQQKDHADAMATHSAAFTSQMEALETRIAAIVTHADTADTKLTNSVQGLTERLSAGQAVLIGANSEIATLTDASVRLLELIEAGSAHGREKIPAALNAAEAQLTTIENRISSLQGSASHIITLGNQFHGSVAASEERLGAAASELTTLHANLMDQSTSQHASLAAMLTSLEQIEAKSVLLASRAQSELTAAIDQLQHAAQSSVENLGDNTADAVTRLSSQLVDKTGNAIDKVIAERSAEVAGKLEVAVAKAAELSRAATIQLRDQLSKVDELTGNLERRVNQARTRAEEQVDDDFARRVALITEALNSNAIDIAQTLEADVSDIAWNAYLKGDRGIFTRRAVNIIQNSEAKAILQVYHNDDTFRGHANRFIHDFEAMLRQVLSTRDGNALGVTLLSSDMGKLYVALAQAIERLRT